MNDVVYFVCAVSVVAAATILTRALPFLIFGNRPLPEAVRYLGEYLPPAIMVILVIYCMRGISFTAYPFGAPEIISCAAVVLLHLWKKNMYVSIIGGTVCYMALCALMV
ncbi:MAG: branched-chain amino acid transporter AzlD [Eubacteriaceae bacterium]|jgi:branched-subunit amino acid transport protein AzlD|nr:branched-chain amino acid transporter AzlD [Eubacteriaceae bacterium]